ncbi:sodium:proton antiporter [Bacteroidia bacterium]|nr:sodium:proton antiporter [Bacteroidia bacterium]
MDSPKTAHQPSGKALLPLAVFFVLYILTFIFTGDLGKMPVSVAFLTASAVAVLTSKGGGVNERIERFCKGCANDTILLMVVIFILAGAFAGAAKAMGAVDATVNMLLSLLPQQAILASIFVASCFISMSMGTSCGTIAALAPIAVGIAAQTGLSLPALIGVVVGGSMFGDNLSFISDTTIVATRTQGIRMRDKFKANLRMVLPVAIIVLLIYIFQGTQMPAAMRFIAPHIEEVEWLKTIPYLVVLIMALCGVNVITVLSLGVVLSGTIGLITGGFSVWEWTGAMSKGIVSDMGELIIVSLMAGGMFELLRYNGGIDWLIHNLTRRIHSQRSAETAIAGLTVFTDLCTANNTIALIITGPIAKTISTKFTLDSKRIAGLIDTASCFIQALLPYGAQLLIASGLAGINPMAIVPHLYYPMGLGLAVVISILIGRKS